MKTTTADGSTPQGAVDQEKTKRKVTITVTEEQFNELKNNEELNKKVWEIMNEPEMKTNMAIAIARREAK